MLQAFLNIFKIPELRNKLLFTIGMLVIYRIGFFIPLAAVNQDALKDFAENQKDAGGGMADLLAFVNIFTGGSLGQSTLFGLGILPYISAAIIFQLLATVLEPLKNLHKEGPAGRQNCPAYTRYATFALLIIPSLFYRGFFDQQLSRRLVPNW